MAEELLIKKNGYTKVPHFLIEQLMKRNFSEYESSILLMIIRWTYGWHRKEAKISHGDYKKHTGIGKAHVWSTLCKLIQKNIIGKRAEGREVYYWVEEEVEKWGISLRGDVSSRGDTISPCEGVQISLSREAVNKRNKLNKRENIYSDDSSKGDFFEIEGQSSKSKEFLDWYQVEHKEKKSYRYMVMPKDQKLVEETLQTFSIEELKTFAERFLTEDDPFVKKAGCSIAVFKSQLPRLASTRKKMPIGWCDYSKYR